MNLIINNLFLAHSGNTFHYKIDCDSLSDDDIEALAKIIASKRLFYEVIGVPRGGIRLASALEKYKGKNCTGSNFPVEYSLLIVDDVLTTGRSMQEYFDKHSDNWESIGGAVIFARTDNVPAWIMPIFTTTVLS
jgi:orotate phosphoribosyltransferase